jgi:5-methylcytosine-specific restriction endonuclease McrA
MAKKNPTRTTNSQIRSALRQLFLRSRERSSRIKGDRYTCQRCGKKQSKAKGREVAVEVHHKHGGIQNWAALIAAVREYLLCDPSQLETLCVDCHKSETYPAQEPAGADFDPLAGC